MSIRTTVVLDEDVLERLKDEARSRGVPLRQALNDVLRSSLLAPRQEPQAPFRIEPKHMGTTPGLNYDNVAALLEFGEGDNYR
jgi:hypothetical protein